VERLDLQLHDARHKGGTQAGSFNHQIRSGQMEHRQAKQRWNTHSAAAFCSCFALCHLPCQSQCFVVALDCCCSICRRFVCCSAGHCAWSPLCQAELQAHLTSSVDRKVVDLCVCAGVDGLSKKIQEVKDFVDERVDALSRKQDDLADSQDEMKDQLEDVQQNISGVMHTCTCFMLPINQSINLHCQFVGLVRGVYRQ